MKGSRVNGRAGGPAGIRETPLTLKGAKEGSSATRRASSNRIHQPHHKPSSASLYSPMVGQQDYFLSPHSDFGTLNLLVLEATQVCSYSIAMTRSDVDTHRDAGPTGSCARATRCALCPSHSQPGASSLSCPEKHKRVIG